MSSLATIAEPAVATNVRLTREALIVELRDGRVVSVPLAWYPRLLAASQSERRRWQLIGPGIGVHWPLIDEDVSVEALLAGRGSNEGSQSFRRWAANRQGTGATAAKRRPSTRKAR